MSRYTHNTVANGKDVQAVAGWDRRLGYFTYQVQDLQSGEMICTNLASANAFSDDIQDAVDAFAEVGVTMPEKMLEQLVADKEGNEGNRIGSF